MTRDELGRPIELFGANVDITERKRADEQFRLAIEAAPTGMLLADHTGSIVLVNAQIEKLFGHPRAELLGKAVEVLVPARFRPGHPALRTGFHRAPSARAMGPGRELHGLRSDGSEFPVEVELNPLQTSEGEFVLCSIVDLSQRREIERMRSDFVSTVSHELRTPLTSIGGSLGLLRSGALGALPEQAAAMVRIAYENSGRLVKIINDILDIGGLETGRLTLRMSSMPVAALVQQSIEANLGYAERCDARLVLESPQAADHVRVDPDRFIQVITNLLSNAAKFSPAGATVSIRIRTSPATIRIEVEDSGPGIPEAFQDRVFEKFAQADASATRQFAGTGLGLSIARNLIEAMEGTIGFTNRAGGGTIFHVELPRVDVAAPPRPDDDGSTTAEYQALLPAAAAAARSGSLGASRPPRILYVEDDADLVSVIRATLADRAEIVPAHSLKEAEALLRRGKFDMVILDQMLPDGNCIDLIDRIPLLGGESVPIIILSVTEAPYALRRKVAAALIKSQVSAARIATTILSYLPLRQA